MFYLNTRQSHPDIDKLDGFRSLPRGWHYGTGGPISIDVISKAREINRFYHLLGFSRTDFFAGADGDVLATAYYRNAYVGADIEPNGEHSILYEDGNIERLSKEGLNMNELKRAIIEAAGAIWNTSVSSTPGNYDHDRGKFND